MKHYDSGELDTKIHGFLNRKFSKYPELRVQYLSQIDNPKDDQVSQAVYPVALRAVG